MGNIIYHYTTIKKSKSIIKKKVLYLGNAQNMDDPTDRVYANISAISALMKSNSADAVKLKDTLSFDEIMEISYSTLSTPFYIASFCKTRDNPKLWTNYARRNNGCGVAIGIDRSVFFDKLDSKIRELTNSDDCVENGWNQDRFPRNILEFRNVRYDNLEVYFDEILQSLKPIFCDSDQSNSGDNYKHWLEMALIVLSGTIKNKIRYMEDEEVRLIFKNDMDNWLCYCFVKDKVDPFFKSLGLMGEPNKVKGTTRFHFDFSSICDPELIPEVVLDGYSKKQVAQTKRNLIKAGLTTTKVINKKGNPL